MLTLRAGAPLFLIVLSATVTALAVEDVLVDFEGPHGTAVPFAESATWSPGAGPIPTAWRYDDGRVDPTPGFISNLPPLFGLTHCGHERENPGVSGPGGIRVSTLHLTLEASARLSIYTRVNISHSGAVGAVYRQGAAFATAQQVIDDARGTDGSPQGQIDHFETLSFYYGVTTGGLWVQDAVWLDLADGSHLTVAFVLSSVLTEAAEHGFDRLELDYAVPFTAVGEWSLYE